MNALARHPLEGILERDLELPHARLSRLRLRLGHDRETGKVAAASWLYGVDPRELAELVDRWCDELDSRHRPASVAPWFTLDSAGVELSFAHRRSREPSALPLLLLHGFWGSLLELECLAAPLVDPAAHEASARDAFHVVCPALPGFGVSPAGGQLSVSDIADACVELMARLGYRRYVVHGSDLGSTVAAHVAARDPEHVAALHVTCLQAFPDEASGELAGLTSAEKSQLAGSSALHAELRDELPESPIEDLAFALQKLADVERAQLLSRGGSLLVSLTWAWALGDVGQRRALYAGARLQRAPAFRAPVALDTYPLDAPVLRRFIESRFRVLRWVEHEQGGCLPALEAPEQLLQALRRSFSPFR
jgi:pimeloyl-ACP methyl ester carboxylesterase